MEVNTKFYPQTRSYLQCTLAKKGKINFPLWSVTGCIKHTQGRTHVQKQLENRKWTPQFFQLLIWYQIQEASILLEFCLRFFLFSFVLKFCFLVCVFEFLLLSCGDLGEREKNREGGEGKSLKVCKQGSRKDLKGVWEEKNKIKINHIKIK